MTVLDVLETASLYLNLREELDYYFNENNSTTPSDEVVKKFNNLLKALNLTVKEIATEFKTLFYEEKKTFENNKLKISTLSQKLFKVFEVKDENKAYNFKIIDDYIVINSNGEKVVSYAYVPEELESSDDICYLDNIYEKTLALGTCMEYYYLTNIFDEATIWEDRYNKSLQNCLRESGKHNLPKRRWF